MVFPFCDLPTFHSQFLDGCEIMLWCRRPGNWNFFPIRRHHNIISHPSKNCERNVEKSQNGKTTTLWALITAIFTLFFKTFVILLFFCDSSLFERNSLFSTTKQRQRCQKKSKKLESRVNVLEAALKFLRSYNLELMENLEKLGEDHSLKAMKMGDQQHQLSD